MSENTESKLSTLESLYEISQILNCDIDRESLALTISLCEQGVNPEALSVRNYSNTLASV
jgi:mitotic-spindle organizing protein 1